MNNSATTHSNLSPGNVLPCVVQVGFAGTREFSPDHPLTAQLEASLIAQLRAILDTLPGQLHLSPNHFLCGISQLAGGADTLFTKACAAEGIYQRIFLPQTRDAFLNAVGSDGSPDFTDGQRAVAVELFDSPHVIQERVVSESTARRTRFVDTNIAILRASDVVIAWTEEGSSDATGGTRHFLTHARQSNLPALELSIDWTASSEPKLMSKWWFPEVPATANPDAVANKSPFPPQLPEAIRNCPAPVGTGPQQLPTVTQFCETVKSQSSREAQRHRDEFSRVAIIILVTHCLATLLATLVLAFHHHAPSTEKPGSAVAARHSDLVEWATSGHGHGSGIGWVALLGLELLCLCYGFQTHRRLHHHKTTEGWAMSRLLAEIQRSTSHLSQLHMYLDYLFELRLPEEFRFLMRTINVLHLKSTRTLSQQDVARLRDRYLSARFNDSQTGQIGYYRARLADETVRLQRAHRIFVIGTILAAVATFMKAGLLLLVGLELINIDATAESFLASVCGVLAVLLPVLAVAGMSWSAARDYEARVAIYRDMELWLIGQRSRIEQALTIADLRKLVAETELRLLSENTEWYSRRAYTGVN